MRMLRTYKRQYTPELARAKYILLVTKLAGQRDLVVAALVVNLCRVSSYVIQGHAKALVYAPPRRPPR